jgi:hypothetical protein
LNPKVQCRSLKCAQIVPILIENNPIPRTYLKSILIFSSHMYLDLPEVLFPVGLPVKILKALLPSSILATCSAHLNVPDLFTLTIIHEWYKL